MKENTKFKSSKCGGRGQDGGFDKNNLCMPIFNWECESQDFKVRSSTVQLT